MVKSISYSFFLFFVFFVDTAFSLHAPSGEVDPGKIGVSKRAAKPVGGASVEDNLIREVQTHVILSPLVPAMDQSSYDALATQVLDDFALSDEDYDPEEVAAYNTSMGEVSGKIKANDSSACLQMAAQYVAYQYVLQPKMTDEEAKKKAVPFYVLVLCNGSSSVLQKAEGLCGLASFLIPLAPDSEKTNGSLINRLMQKSAAMGFEGAQSYMTEMRHQAGKIFY